MGAYLPILAELEMKTEILKIEATQKQNIKFIKQAYINTFHQSWIDNIMSGSDQKTPLDTHERIRVKI